MMRTTYLALVLLFMLYRLPMSGQSWVEIDTKFPGDYMSITSAGADSLFLSDYDYLLRSTDAGSTWTKHRYKPQGSVGARTISFPTARVGYAGGYGVYKTTDGGVTWDSIFTARYVNRPAETRASWFLQEDVGFMLGEVDHRTTDGGKTWPRVYASTPQVEAVCFVNDSVGFLGGWINSAFGIVGSSDKTVDGGATWHDFFYLQHPNGRALMDFQINAMSFVNERVGWIGGERYPGSTTHPNTRVMFTTDGGDTWDTVSQVFPHAVNCIEFVDEKVGVVGDNKGWIFTTIDGGATWSVDSTSAQGRAIKDLCVVNGSTIYACGEGGLLLRQTLTSSVDAVHADLALHIFPNPVRGLCTMMMPDDGMSQASTLVIHDLDGRALVRMPVVDRTTHMDVSSWPCGVYAVRVTNSRGVLQGRIVVSE